MEVNAATEIDENFEKSRNAAGAGVRQHDGFVGDGCSGRDLGGGDDHAAFVGARQDAIDVVNEGNKFRLFAGRGDKAWSR